MTLTRGARIGYAHPRTLTLSSPYVKNVGGVTVPGYEPDLVCLRPTLMVAVPAILDLIASGIKAQILQSTSDSGLLYI